MQCSALRKNGYVVIKGRPCKIVDMSTSKTGKHGHAKVHLVATDIFTNKKLEDLSPSTHNMDVPNVRKNEYPLLDIEDGFFSLMQEDGSTKDDVKVPDNEIGKAIEAAFGEGKELLVSVTSAMAVTIQTELAPKRMWTLRLQSTGQEVLLFQDREMMLGRKTQSSASRIAQAVASEASGVWMNLLDPLPASQPLFFVDDKTVSKRHALLRFDPEKVDAQGLEESGLDRAMLTTWPCVTDLGSTHGTAVDGVPVPENTFVLLRHGSTLSVGQAEFRLERVEMSLCPSSLDAASKKTLVRIGSRFGMTIEKDLSPQTKYLIMKKITITQKLVTALCRAIPIVTMAWIHELERTAVLPPISLYVPPMQGEGDWAAGASFLPNPDRKRLLDGVGLILFDDKDLSTLGATAKECGGIITKCLLTTPDDFDGFLQQFLNHDHVVCVSSTRFKAPYQQIAKKHGIKTIVTATVYQCIVLVDKTQLQREHLLPKTTPMAAPDSDNVTSPIPPSDTTPGNSLASPVPIPASTAKPFSAISPTPVVQKAAAALSADDDAHAPTGKTLKRKLSSRSSVQTRETLARETKISTRSLFEHFSTSVSQAPDFTLPTSQPPGRDQLPEDFSQGLPQSNYHPGATQRPLDTVPQTQTTLLDSFLDDVLEMGVQAPPPPPPSAQSFPVPGTKVIKVPKAAETVSTQSVPARTNFSKLQQVPATTDPKSDATTSSQGTAPPKGHSPAAKTTAVSKPTTAATAASAELSKESAISITVEMVSLVKPSARAGRSHAAPIDQPVVNFKRFRRKGHQTVSRLVRCAPASALEGHGRFDHDMDP
ncbi:Eukaryotic translation initiation factor 5A [Kappamyces sp. JEL0680]|nr:Eukaryotic translation initiation factor 5A [Kappamyces sp. JEL0680]